VGESFLPSVIVSICDDRDNTFKATDEGVLGLKNDFGQNEPDPFHGVFGITGVGSQRKAVGEPSSTRPSERVRMCSDGGLTIDSSSSLSSSDDDDSDNDDLPSSDDDSGFGFSAIRGALTHVSSSLDGASSSSKNATSGAESAGVGGVAVARGRDVAVPVRFTVPLTASLEIVWEAILCRKALIVPRLPSDGAAGSKESLIQLLEFAEDQLGCESVFICLPKGDFASGDGMKSTPTLVRMFSFLGFNNVNLKDRALVESLPSVFRSMPALVEGTVVQYDIEDSDF